MNAPRPDLQSPIRSLWDAVVISWLAFMILFGGVTIPSSTMVIVQTALSLLLICGSLWFLRQGLPSKAAVFGAFLAGSALLLVLLQTVPLPFELWSKLPGRQLFLDSFAALGETPTWLPYSIDPKATQGAAVSLIPAVAGYFGAMSLRHTAYSKLALTVIGCALVGLLIGLIQRSVGDSSGLYFYGYKGANMALGTFGNRNFFAAQLFTTIPFIAALAAALMQSNFVRPWLIAIFALIYMALLVVGLAIVGSRAGIALAMLSVLLSVLYVFRAPDGAGVSRKKWSLYVLLISAFIVIQVGMAGIMRLVATDPVDDFRSSIFNVTYEAAKNFFPAGTGFGTFVPVYQIFEQPEVIIDQYVNHAHNDWLEIALEGGAPAILLLALFALVYLVNTYLISRLPTTNTHNFFLRAVVVVIFLMLAHATVDFALRTPALLSLFAVCCGLMVTAQARRNLPGPRSRSGPTAPPSKVKPFAQATRGFATPQPADTSPQIVQ